MRYTLLMVMFDLPVKTRRMTRNAARFRSGLKKLGYTMLQKSIYIKIIPNGSTFRTERKYVREITPSVGDVQILPIPLKHFIKISSLTATPFPLENLIDPIIVIK